MALVLGKDAHLYYNAGTYESPTWTEITNVKDFNLSVEKAKTDVTTRAGGGWRQEKGTLKTGNMTWKMVWDTSDTAFTELQSAFFDDTAIELLATDLAYNASGAQGLRANCDIFKFSRSENLEEALMVDVEAGPTYDSENSPEWYEYEGS